MGPRGAMPADDPDVVCPKCNWTCARRSRRRNGLDWLLALFLLRPFRCRSCQRRYYRLPLFAAETLSAAQRPRKTS